MNQKWNNNKCRCECKNTNNLSWVPKIYIWNPATCRFKNGKYVGSIADNLVTTSDETIEETENASTKSTATKTALAKNS